MNFLRLLEGMRTPLLNNFFQFVTYFGQEILIIAFICTLYWCVNKRFAYLLGFTYFTAGLCVQALKITFRIPRPWIIDPAFQPVESAVSAATGYSFPSGHTQGAVSLFAPMALCAKKKKYAALCVLIFLLVGFSRMYLGVHTPKDVLVSMGISLFFSWLVVHFSTFLLDETRHIRQIAVLLALISFLLCIYALFMLNADIIEQRYASDCLKASGAGLGFALGWYAERTYLNFSVTTTRKYMQVLKVIIGLSASLAVKSLIPFAMGNGYVVKMFEYFILVLWVIFIYPYFFSFFRKK